MPEDWRRINLILRSREIDKFYDNLRRGTKFIPPQPRRDKLLGEIKRRPKPIPKIPKYTHEFMMLMIKEGSFDAACRANRERLEREERLKLQSQAS